MPKITPARPRARHATPNPSSKGQGTGFCLPCYADGHAVLAVIQPDGSVCAVHAREVALIGAERAGAAPGSVGAAAAGIGPGGAAEAPAGGAGRGPRGRRARTERRATERLRTRTQAREAAARRVRAQQTGRVRAAARLARGFAPHPGWRNFVPPGWRVLTSQAEARHVLQALVEAQPWRSDRATSWTQILHTLVEHMDWETGLVTALTAARLGAAGDRAARTVSRVIAWAQDAGVLFVVETGATAEFLGAERNRTPTYALITNAPHSSTTQDEDHNDDQDHQDHDEDQDHQDHDEDQDFGPAGTDPATEKSLLTDPTEEIGDLPNTPVEITTRTKRLEPATPDPRSWPVLQVPRTSTERSIAGRRLLHELSLDPRGVSGRAAMINLSRWWAMLKPWWDTGWSPRGLAWAIEHHPDRPDHHRGDIRAGATDLVAVIGARLKPWRDRHHELPAQLVGIPSDYRTAQAARIDTRIATAAAEQDRTLPPSSSAAVRAQAQAFYRASRAGRGQRHRP